jgi:hypothetical protein
LLILVASDLQTYFISDRRLTRRLIFGRNYMQKIDKFAHAAKVVALSLPPVVMSLVGLAALSRKKGAAAEPADDNLEPPADRAEQPGRDQSVALPLRIPGPDRRQRPNGPLSVTVCDGVHHRPTRASPPEQARFFVPARRCRTARMGSPFSTINAPSARPSVFVCSRIIARVSEEYRRQPDPRSIERCQLGREQ